MAVEPPSTDDLTSGGIGLALSGGGYRSALFGLGALHYLVRSEKIRDLTTIASVSGGSYTNARALMYREDLQKIGEQAFLAHFRPFVEAMASKSPWRHPLVVASYSTLFALLALALGVLDVPVWWRLVCILLLLLLIPWTGRVLARSIWTVLYRDFLPSPPLGHALPHDVVVRVKGRVRRKRALDLARSFEAAEQTVNHIFCTTDLHYAQFTYLSNKAVYNPTLGVGSPADFLVKDAVNASAAIPPIFAAMPLKTSGFVKPPPDAPRRLLSADGGIYDALATEWFMNDACKMRSRFSWADASEPARCVLVLDGSRRVQVSDYVPGTTTPFQRSRIPVFWWFGAHVRSARIAIENWDRRNFEAIASQAAVTAAIARPTVKYRSQDKADSAESRWLAALSVFDSPFALGLSEAKRICLRRDDLNWRELILGHHEVPTYPKKLPTERIVGLMYHGYVMAWASMEDNASPEPLPGFKDYSHGWFG